MYINYFVSGSVITLNNCDISSISWNCSLKSLRLMKYFYFSTSFKYIVSWTDAAKRASQSSYNQYEPNFTLNVRHAPPKHRRMQISNFARPTTTSVFSLLEITRKLYRIYNSNVNGFSTTYYLYQFNIRFSERITHKYSYILYVLVFYSPHVGTWNSTWDGKKTCN
jgi:hypothetical protein